jgi:hypothetical protein
MSFPCRPFRVFIQLLIVFIVPLWAAFDHLPHSPRSASMGYIAFNLDPRGNNAMITPSSLAQLESISGSINWGNRFGLKDLSHQSGNVKFTLFDTPADAGFSQFGNALYRESIFYFASGSAVKSNFFVGASITVYNLVIKNYGSASAFGITGSWQMSINEYLTWSGALQNINAPSIGKTEEPLPQVIYTECLISPSEKLITVFGWEQDTEYSGRFKFGTEYKVFPWLSISSGFISNPGQGTAGISVYIKNVGLYYGASTHPELGLSHWFGLGFSAD